MDIEPGRVAVITGGAGGIGYALAQALGARGLKLVLGDVEAPALDAAAEALRDSGFEVEARLCDVTDPAAVQALAEAALARFGAIDLAFNNAGVGGPLCPLWETHPDDVTWTVGVNLTGVLNGVRAFAKPMVARGSGRIVNIASLAGLTAPPFLSIYAATKHAVVGLSESLAAELAMMAPGVKVSVVCPAFVASRIFESERNRPAALSGAPATPSEGLSRIRAGLEAMITEVMPADELAARVIAGIEAERFYILTHPKQAQAAIDRAEAVAGAARALMAAG